MLERIEIRERLTLEDYEALAHLAPAVRELRSEASSRMSVLKGRRLVMVNSTAQGGGVAEMLPRIVTILRELGLPTEWVVMGSDDPDFFRLTKKLHNLIHGVGKPEVNSGERELYEKVNRQNATQLESFLQPGDLLVVHDPQPMAIARYVRDDIDVAPIWRCHIGLDERVPATRAAWNFLKPYAEAYEHGVFSAPEYIPDFFSGRASIIHPALDPLSHKNRDISPHKLTGILCNAGLFLAHQPVLTSAFPKQVQRLQPNGRFASALQTEDLGLLFRPVVTQVSRWDRLKGWLPLLEAFVHLKRTLHERPGLSIRHRRRLDITRLVLAGPDPDAIQDDPEGQEVIAELCQRYRSIPPEIQRDIALLSLPMDSRKQNALIVNALQRVSTVVVQNSIQEGFGLTATEAMLKGRAVLVSHACGLRQQVRDEMDGRMCHNPEDPSNLATFLDGMLAHPRLRTIWGRSAQRRAFEEFLVFTQVRNWLRLFDERVRHPRPARP
ncbi:MAG: glycosyltransferase [Planctomycetota bacterium]|jgi:trehalose synthase